MIHTTLFARLNDNPAIANVVTGILPAQGEINQPTPFLVYTIQSEDQATFTDGQSSLIKFNIQIDGYDTDKTPLETLMDSVRDSLNGWRGGNVQYCRITGSSDDKQETHHHASQSYELSYSSANVVALVDSTSTITTGAEFIELEACDNVLRLDCDGITLNGDELSPDLSDYARLSQPNTFTAAQTVNGALTATTISGSGPSLTGLNASNLASGTVADARLSANVPLKNAQNTFTRGQTVQPTTGDDCLTMREFGHNFLTLKNFGGATIGSINQNATCAMLSFSGNGTSLTGLNASNLASGTVADARLSANVPLKDTANTFTAAQTIQPNLVVTQTTSTVPVVIHATGSTDALQVKRISDDAVGLRVIGCSGLQVATNLVMGGTSSIADDGNARLFFYFGTTPKLLFSSQFGIFASDVPLNWDNGTTITGSPDIGLIRSAAGVLKVTNGSSGYGELVAGNIGIGVTPTDADDTLHVRGTTSNAELFIDAPAGGGIPVLRFGANGTKSWTIYQNSTGRLGFGRYGAGDIMNMTAADKVGIGTSLTGTTEAARLHVVSADAAVIGEIVQGVTSQTANLQEWQDSNANVLAKVDAYGHTTLRPYYSNDVPLTVTSPASRTASITGAQLTSNVATITTSVAHGFIVGETVIITISVGGAPYTGVYTITAVPSTTTFSYAKTNANIAFASKSGSAIVVWTTRLQEWRNSADTLMASVDVSGGISAVSITTSGAVNVGTDVNANNGSFGGSVGSASLDTGPLSADTLTLNTVIGVGPQAFTLNNPQLLPLGSTTDDVILALQTLGLITTV